MTIQQTLIDAMHEAEESGHENYVGLARAAVAALASLADASGLLVIDTRTGQVCEVVPLAQYADDNIVGYAVVRPEGSQQP